MLQINAIEAACIEYLLDLKFLLPPTQLGQLLALFDRLMLKEASDRMLKSFLRQTWAEQVMAVLAVLFKQLLADPLDDLSYCLDLLDRSTCGALCELQVKLVVVHFRSSS